MKQFYVIRVNDLFVAGACGPSSHDTAEEKAQAWYVETSQTRAELFVSKKKALEVAKQINGTVIAL